MGQVLVRNLPDDVVPGLKRRAAQNGRSMEAEIRAVLIEAARSSHDDFWALADRLREETRGRIAGDSTALIREDRDR